MSPGPMIVAGFLHPGHPQSSIKVTGNTLSIFDNLHCGCGCEDIRNKFGGRTTQCNQPHAALDCPTERTRQRVTMPYWPLH
eukprot:6037465-Amphidinium_carterae.2